MRKTVKRIFSLILLIVLIISTVEVKKFEISASTTDTMYSAKHLQNGSFEENMSDYTFSNGYVQPNRTAVPYWDTTAYGGKLEFFQSGNDYHFKVTKKYYPDNPEYWNVADGAVAAELNADEESTIYQRINTVPALLTLGDLTTEEETEQTAWCCLSARSNLWIRQSHRKRSQTSS